MTLLAIDTATQTLGLALHDGQRLLADVNVQVGRGHNAQLAPLIERTMAQVGLAKDDLSALAVAVGPGSYTGVRIGVALAKGMAEARGLPLVPVSTFDALVEPVPHYRESPSMIVTLAAGRNRVIHALYWPMANRWAAWEKEGISAWDDLLAEHDYPLLFTGEISDEGMEKIRAADDEHIIMPAAMRLRRAGYVADIAWRRLREQGADAFPAADVKPVYMRSP